MIEIKQIHGKSAPIFICDQCKERITEPTMGIVVFNHVEEGETSPAWHLHKGKCDKEFQKGKEHLAWQELKHHLIYLTFNAGLSPEELASEHKELVELGWYNL